MYTVVCEKRAAISGSIVGPKRAIINGKRAEQIVLKQLQEMGLSLERCDGNSHFDFINKEKKLLVEVKSIDKSVNSFTIKFSSKEQFEEFCKLAKEFKVIFVVVVQYPGYRKCYFLDAEKVIEYIKKHKNLDVKQISLTETDVKNISFLQKRAPIPVLKV